jgi:hypothetical protein
MEFQSHDPLLSIRARNGTCTPIKNNTSDLPSRFTFSVLSLSWQSQRFCPQNSRGMGGEGRSTAGSAERRPCSGHEFGGQGVTDRSAPGQHGSSCQAYRMAVISVVLRRSSGRAAVARFQLGWRWLVVVFQPQAGSAGLCAALKHCGISRADSQTPPSERFVRLPPYRTSSGEVYSR